MRSRGLCTYFKFFQERIKALFSPGFSHIIAKVDKGLRFKVKGLKVIHFDP